MDQTQSESFLLYKGKKALRRPAIIHVEKAGRRYQEPLYFVHQQGGPAGHHEWKDVTYPTGRERPMN